MSEQIISFLLIATTSASEINQQVVGSEDADIQMNKAASKQTSSACVQGIIEEDRNVLPTSSCVEDLRE